MFKNIQKYLLINYPLLWNTKVAPTAVILIVINLIFFIIGLEKGKLDFFENDNNYTYDDEAVVIFFSILVSILSLIMWLVFYFKNNSFKSFYPKRTLSLFKEWSIVLFICILISLFTSSYYYGKDVRIRSYFTKQEAKSRCETLSKASFFVEGSFSNNYNYDYSEVEVVEAAKATVTASDTAVTVNDSILFNGKKYSYFSLLNKNVNSYSFFDYDTDSIRKKTIKTWLVNQQKDSIKSIFKKYLAIAKEHNLRANIDENKWLDLVYDYPNFMNYRSIGPSDVNHEYYENVNQPRDSINKYIKVINGMKYEYYKYFVPEKSLNYNYNKISEAWVSPNMNFTSILIPFYFATALSLLIFAFRVTSGRNWLIAVISLGVVSILLGIFSIIINSDYSFAITLILLTLSTFIYFFVIISRKKSKNISGVILNVMLWLFPSFFPLIYYVVLEVLKDLAQAGPLDYLQSEYYPAIQFMKDSGLILAYLNIVFIIILMLFLSVKIKQWRGLAEG